MYGFIYVMANKTMPNVYKIGYTNGSPLRRAKELSNTSIPFDYEVVCYGEIDNASEFECRIHRELNSRRVNLQREFFSLQVDELINLANIIKEHSENFVECEYFNNILWMMTKNKGAKNETNA